MNEKLNALSGEVIGAAIEVHRVLGPGLLESMYESCLEHELELRGIPCKRQVPLDVIYKGRNFGPGYRMDIVVDDRLLLELKSVRKLEEIDTAQVLTYLKLSRLPLGLLMNFNVPVLRDGIKRLILGDLKEYQH